MPNPPPNALDNATIQLVHSLARRPMHVDNVNDDAAGSYFRGVADGRIELARLIMKRLNINWSLPSTKTPDANDRGGQNGDHHDVPPKP